ncbi:hypothetical protein R3P38DRAFT_1630461 [Favolaschia claudopus]|uniref:F-box domain-containing protein n=1 Tax=Favolaschia claudopus TaxID=2862362 RepID=A0AAW0DK68_9AGAR
MHQRLNSTTHNFFPLFLPNLIVEDPPMAYRNADSRNVSWPVASSQTDATLGEHISALRMQMDAVRAKTEALDAKSAALQQELAAVAHQKAGCQTEMTKLERELRIALEKVPHIISRLPPEILCEIFHWTLLSEEDYTRRVNGRNVLVAPWRLCRVNGHWRAVARADPHLWSRIVINCDQIWHEDSVQYVPCIPPLEYPLGALQTQLSLSRAASISVEFHLDAASSDQHFQYLTDLLNLLIAECHRWVQLIIGEQGIPEISVFNLLSQVHGRLDQLRHLQVDEWGSGSWPLALRDAFAVAPNLQEVSLPYFLRIHRDHPSSYISLDYRQLTTLHMSVGQSLVLELLSALQNVVDLTLVLEWNHQESITGSMSNLITLPRLRRITLDLDTDPTQYLVTPNLESLQLSDYGIEHIPPFIRRSACQLQSLKITFASKNKGWLAAVIDILRVSPDLSHLELDLDPESSEKRYLYLLTRLLSALTLTHAPSDICAKLTTFEFYIWDDDTTRQFGDALCGMLESRWNTPVHQRCLRRVRMPEACYEVALWERLEALRLDGLDIEEFFTDDLSDDEDSDDESE